ncbi:MAG: hypothetical protein ACK4RK_01975 [Gemmataceae bacterium]
MLRLCWIIALSLSSLGISVAAADESTAALLKDIEAFRAEGPASPTTRAAWNQLVARGPAVLPDLLAAMDTPDTVTANWLRTAFDRIANDARARRQPIDTDALLTFIKDPKHQGRTRRLALDLVEELRPGTRAALIPGWLDDPEFRFEAVADTVMKADRLTKEKQNEAAILLYQKAFAACRDPRQTKEVAVQLKEHGVTVSPAEHLGFLTDWYILGPFPAHEWKGFATVYPPEESYRRTGQLPPAPAGMTWKRQQCPVRGVADRHVILVNILESLGVHHDAVAYAFTTIILPEAQEVEFRGAADDNFTVWVNGQKRFGFEEYRNGVRHDRHRFPVRLHQGANTVLVKICQAPLDDANPQPNWEFFLRVVDPTGKGIAMKNALPELKP